MRYESPLLAIALFVLWCLFFVYLVFFKDKTSRSFPSSVSFQKKSGFLTQAFLNLSFVLYFVAGVFLILAFARPQSVDERVIKKSKGIDIIATLDISDSMLIEDMQPHSRLRSAKKTISNFIKGRETDRIGLVVFSGEAYTRVPLTMDYRLLQKSLARVQTQANLKKGTAIGVALATATSRLIHAKGRSKVIVLLTDGENNSGSIDPSVALKLAIDVGVKIYTVGVGKDGMAKLPIYTKDFRGRKIKTTRMMPSYVNETLLKEMAQKTGGKYFRASDSVDLDQIFKSINNLEKTNVETFKFEKINEEFQYFVWWGFIFLLFGLFWDTLVAWRVLG